jgi:hypothetical protein
MEKLFAASQEEPMVVSERLLLRVQKVIAEVEGLLESSVSKEELVRFADRVYPEIHDLYYDAMPQQLSDEQREYLIQVSEAVEEHKNAKGE